MQADRLTLSVVICAHTEQRWDELRAAIASVRAQTYSAAEIIVIVDHNNALLQRLRASEQDITISASTEHKGLAGARNTGLRIAKGDVVVFLDDDAAADAYWLENLAGGYGAQIMGVGGLIAPAWEAGRPAWFPEEFLWVVGCTYRGLPEHRAAVRNLIGCNMSLRREVFAEIGGFQSGMGRVGSNQAGCEETELCIRARQRWPQKTLIYEPRAGVQHRVPANRASWRYFVRRCFAEGMSKAQVARYVGLKDGLASERSYTLKTLPAGVLTNMADLVLKRDPAGLARAAAIILGLLVTSLGYLAGKSSRQTARSRRGTSRTVVS